MRALWDFIELPYQACVPWPVVIDNGHIDWFQSQNKVESWLLCSVGDHYTAWVWSMWRMDRSDICAVSFRVESHCSLFLLRWG